MRAVPVRVRDGVYGSGACADKGAGGEASTRRGVAPNTGAELACGAQEARALGGRECVPRGRGRGEGDVHVELRLGLGFGSGVRVRLRLGGGHGRRASGGWVRECVV